MCPLPPWSPSGTLPNVYGASVNVAPRRSLVGCHGPQLVEAGLDSVDEVVEVGQLDPEAIITPAMAAEDFPTAMAAMASLRAPIDAFFTAVQVNSDNQIVRRNRLNLLHRICQTCLSVADLRRIEG